MSTTVFDTWMAVSEDASNSAETNPADHSLPNQPACGSGIGTQAHLRLELLLIGEPIAIDIEFQNYSSNIGDAKMYRTSPLSIPVTGTSETKFLTPLAKTTATNIFCQYHNSLRQEPLTGKIGHCCYLFARWSTYFVPEYGWPNMRFHTPAAAQRDAIFAPPSMVLFYNITILTRGDGALFLLASNIRPLPHETLCLAG
ncbi:hypothetical protein CKM354_001006300 [Cercospora kikuchii]|uniref:Uncharacterized protein n=1 Tax=Cercospora kikuchii TaxID=84275 RepID=A0A9P3CQP0_9PEZI|nr:uncharacterized protein CKM354_001006300 [Cercospora kikuchii]GIZ46961.1 hypothetical protein CKM354_001006300 [Cercospora kikuchii]